MSSDICGICSKYILTKDGVKCSKCKLFLHKNCVGIPLKTAVSASWKCPRCKKGNKKNKECELYDIPLQLFNSEDTPDTSTQKYLSQEFTNKDIMDEIRGMRIDFLNFCKDVSDLKVEMRSCLTRIATLETRIEILEKRACDRSEEPIEVKDIVSKLRTDLNDRDQLLLCNDLEIRNIYEEKEENPTQLVVTVARKLGVNLVSQDVVIAERVGGRLFNGNGPERTIVQRPRTLVVRLARRELRDEILKKARERRTANISGKNFSGFAHQFFINERLTKINRQLLQQARNAARKNGWKFVWTRRGRIFARRQPGDTIATIRDEKDIVNKISQNTDTV